MSTKVWTGRVDATEFTRLTAEEGGWKPIEGDPASAFTHSVRARACGPVSGALSRPRSATRTTGRASYSFSRVRRP